MKHNHRIAGLLAMTVLGAGYFLVPLRSAAASPDSEQITKLLADAKAEAVELKADSADLESLTRSTRSWESHAGKIEMIKEHVNNSGKLLTKLQEVEAEGAPWQQTVIQRIEPLLKELAANTEATINYLDDNRSKIHFPEYRDYVKANYDLATDLEALIRDFVNYGEARDKMERLGAKHEITS